MLLHELYKVEEVEEHEDGVEDRYTTDKQSEEDRYTTGKQLDEDRYTTGKQLDEDREGTGGGWEREGECDGGGGLDAVEEGREEKEAVVEGE